MTQRDWTADRDAVFDRDAFTCRHCDAGGNDDEQTPLHLYPVGDVPLEGTVHESALVTVCDECFATLTAAPSDATPASDDLFHRVRETTRLQGATISDVAAFASLSTSLPTTIETALDDETDTTIRDTVSEYRHTRRDVLLALAMVDARLEGLDALESPDDPAVRSSLTAFSETATTLQSTLRAVVTAGETVATGLERCHGCFSPLEGTTCQSCGLDARDTDEWQRDDGTIAFDRLFAAINEALQDASETTETLTDRTMTLAEHLTA